MTDGECRTDDGKVLHSVAAVTGNARSPSELPEREASVYQPNEDADEHHCRPPDEENQQGTQGQYHVKTPEHQNAQPKLCSLLDLKPAKVAEVRRTQDALQRSTQIVTG